MPALLKIKRSIDNEVWKINFTLETASIPESDKELMRKFGEPEINVGGTFTVAGLGDFTLPDKFIKVKSGLPYLQEFDAKSPDFSANTQEKALAFEEEFVTRYAQAFTTLRSSEDTFTGERVENI
jgi:hypothetical protein